MSTRHMERGAAGFFTGLNARMRIARKRMSRHWQLYFVILLPLAYIVIFNYVPMYGAQIAFKDFMASKGILGSPWVGLKNFRDFFQSPQFSRLISNTLGISVYTLIAGFPMPIILALALNEARGQTFRKTVQMVTYAPYFISMIVMVSILMQFLSPQAGVVNSLIKLLGGRPVNFMAIPQYFKSIYVFSGIWQYTGYNSIIYIAALAGIDPTLHEAATVDGATIFQKILYINLPGILPTAIVLLILNSGQIMNVGFEKIYLMQNSLNMRSSDVISTYVYRIGLLSAQYSFSTAVGLFNSVINATIMVTVNRIARKLGGVSLW